MSFNWQKWQANFLISQTFSQRQKLTFDSVKINSCDIVRTSPF